MSSSSLKTPLSKGLFAVAVGIAIWLIPVPEGLKDPKAWKLFAIFVSTILGFILQPLPMGAIASIAICVTTATGVLSVDAAVSGLANSAIWLTVVAFIFSRAFIVSNLGRRIAYMLVKAIGTSPLKLAYALCLSDLAIAPATPSNTARCGGIIFPMVRSLATVLNSEPGPTAKRVGSFLIQAVYNCDTVCSAMFLTGSSANVFLIVLATKTLKLDVSWGLWATAAIVPGIVAFIAVPYFVYRMNPPELKETPAAREVAAKELEALGPMSQKEKVVCGVFAGMLLLWATSNFTHLHATTIAFGGISILFVTRTITWKLALEESAAWDTLMWMGTTVGMASYLNSLGLIPWFAKLVSSHITGFNWMIGMFILTVCYLYAHYGFASLTAHIAALFPAFATVAISIGVPPYLAVLILAFATNIAGSLTHYAQGPTPIYFGAGYVSQGDWWRIGFMLTILQLIIWVCIGATWWKLLGLW